MPYAELDYVPGPARKRTPDSKPIRCVAVWAHPGQSLTATMAKFLSVRPEQLRTELQRLKSNGELLSREQTKGDRSRLQRKIRVEGRVGTVRAYLLVGDRTRWIDAGRTYRPPKPKGEPRRGRLLRTFTIP
jgi:hypothetical protein